MNYPYIPFDFRSNLVLEILEVNLFYTLYGIDAFRYVISNLGSESPG